MTYEEIVEMNDKLKGVLKYSEVEIRQDYKYINFAKDTIWLANRAREMGYKQKSGYIVIKTMNAEVVKQILRKDKTEYITMREDKIDYYLLGSRVKTLVDMVADGEIVIKNIEELKNYSHIYEKEGSQDKRVKELEQQLKDALEIVAKQNAIIADKDKQIQYYQEEINKRRRACNRK